MVPLGVAVLLGVVLPVGAGVAAAEELAGPVVRCAVTDPALTEISGLVDLGERMLVMNDGGDRVSVTVLDAGCQVLETRTADVDPYDPEDLALAADGTMWLADAGDNDASRATVALIALRANGSAAVHRLSYPDGAHDSEALLLAPDGTPYLVTKEVLGSSGVYRPTAPLSAEATVPMERVATVNMTLTGTPGGPVGRAGQLLVTGGAVAGDGHALALRTYTDAYVWPLTGSDVVGALAGTPVRTRAARVAPGRGDQLHRGRPAARGRQRGCAGRRGRGADPGRRGVRGGRAVGRTGAEPERPHQLGAVADHVGVDRRRRGDRRGVAGLAVPQAPQVLSGAGTAPEPRSPARGADGAPAELEP